MIELKSVDTAFTNQPVRVDIVTGEVLVDGLRNYWRAAIVTTERDA